MESRSTLWTLALAVAAALASFLATIGWSRAATMRASYPLERWLGLSTEQRDAVERADPDFASSSLALEGVVRERRERLATLLDDPATPNESLLAQIEATIAAQNDLERRIARYILAIRPHLTADQQKRLLGLCARGVRRSCAQCWFGQAERRGEGRRGGPPWQRDDQPGGRGPARGN